MGNMISRLRRTFSKINGLVLSLIIVFLLALGLSFFKFLQSDVLWTVFFATYLGFALSLLVSMRTEALEESKAREKESEDRQKAVALVRTEIEYNGILVRKLIDHFDRVHNTHPEYSTLTTDPIFFRFEDYAKSGLWTKFVEASNQEFVGLVSDLYRDLSYLNSRLQIISHYVTGLLGSRDNLKEKYRNHLSEFRGLLGLHNLLISSEEKSKRILASWPTH